MSTFTVAHELPLGDGKVTAHPRIGFLMSCTEHWRAGRIHGGPWIHGDSWEPAEKPAVQGNVEWPTHRISITVDGDERVISANNLPDHTTGVFPISSFDPAYQYDRNPNAIQSQNILLRLPLNPKLAESPSCVPMGTIGFTTDGVALYNAVDDGGTDAVAHEVQDRCNGHPQSRGQYHYHGPSPCMNGAESSGPVGYALDGFGIYGMKDAATGKTLHNEDLDACHGTASPVQWNGKQVNMYHYVLTEEYPYTIGCFMGTPVAVNVGRHRDRRMRGRDPGRRPPRGPAGFGPPPGP